MKEKILRKLLERIRGLKKGDYVRYRWKGIKEWFYGRISSIIRVKGEAGYIIYPEEGLELVLIVPEIGDEIHLEIEGRENEDRR